MLTAATHENVPKEYKRFHFRDLATELGKKKATDEDPGPRVIPLEQSLKMLETSRSLGEIDNRDKLDQQLNQQIMDQAFHQDEIEQVEAPALMLKMRQCAPGLLLQMD